MIEKNKNRNYNGVAIRKINNHYSFKINGYHNNGTILRRTLKGAKATIDKYSREVV